MIVVAAGSSFEHDEGLAAVARTIQAGVRQVDGVGVFRVDADFAEVPAAAPDAAVAGHALPIVAAVVGAIESAFLGVDDQVNATRIAGREGDAHAPDAFAGQSMTSDLLPVLARIFGAIETAAGTLRRCINAPGRSPRLQECGEDCLGIAGLEG